MYPQGLKALNKIKTMDKVRFQNKATFLGTIKKQTLNYTRLEI